MQQSMDQYTIKNHPCTTQEHVICELRSAWNHAFESRWNVASKSFLNWHVCIGKSDQDSYEYSN